MDASLSSQLDYIYFAYGMAFFMMALACFGMGRPGRSHLPWALLGLFSVTHGANEWLDLAAYSLGDNPPFAAVRLAVLVASFVFLAEFGRVGMARIGGRPPGIWALAAALGITALGGIYGFAGFNAAARYALGLPGGLYSAYFLLKARRKSPEEENVWLSMSGLALGCYSLAAGLVGPKAGFFPAAVINQDTFAAATGVPIQLVRGALATAASIFIVAYYRASLIKISVDVISLARTVYTYKPLVAVLMVIVAGWFLTEEVGRRDYEEYKQLHVSWTRTIASSLDPDIVYTLSGPGGGFDPEAYSHIRGHLLLVRYENPECTSIMLRTLREGDFVLVADGEREGSPRHREYGHVMEYRAPGEISDYERGVAAAEDMLEGTAVKGVRVKVPIFSGRGETVAQLVMEFDAAAAIRMVRGDRLSSIVITCVLSLFSIAAFIAWYRTRESLAQAAELRLAAFVAENERKLRAVTSALGEGVLQLDADGKVVFVNPEAERLLGYSEKELIGADGHDMLHRRRQDGSAARREDCPSLNVLKTGRTLRSDDEIFTRKDGSFFPVSYVSAPVVAGGRVTGVVVAFQDITSRKQAEEALRESERSYRTLSENLPGMVYRITLGEKSRMQFFNDMVLPMTGYTAEELTGDRLCSLEAHIVEEDLPRVLNTVNLSIMDGTSFQVEYRFSHKDGGIRHFLERGRAILGEDGRASHIDGVILDITERKLAEDELQKFKFIVEGSGEEFYLIDASGRFEYANNAACRGLGYRLEELRGMRLSDIDPAYGETEFKAHADELRRGDVPAFETTHVTRDGRHVVKEVKASWLVIGDRGYIAAIARDISERKELERQRTDFFGIVTHDLKSPLTVIQGYTDIILTEFRDKVPHEVYDACVSIRSSSDKVLRLVEDYLALSRLESGMLPMSFTQGDINELVMEAGVTARALASGRRLDVRVEPCEKIPRIKADQGYLMRALVNLVHNAVNYTPDGGVISLGCSLEEAEGGRYVALSVSDTGPGISPGERDKIFEKYYRSPSATGVKGSGLGLSIVKAVAEAHGGRVVLESQEGKGSTFRLLIPA